MAARDSIRRKPKDTKGTLRKMIAYLEHYKWIMVIVMLLCIISNILALLGPSLAGNAINEASAGAGKVDFDHVFYYAKRMLLVYISSSVITVAINMIMMYVSRYVAKKMRKDIFDKLMKLPVGFFDKNQAGDIISRASYDVDVVSTCLGTDIVAILTSIVTVSGSFGMMLYLSPWLALVSFITIPTAMFYSTSIRKVTQPLFSKRSKKYGEMNGFVEEMFSGQKSIMAYAYEEKVAENFDTINMAASDAFYEAGYHAMTMGPTVGFINNIGLALTAMFGSVLFMMNMITLGKISSFILYSRKFSGPINEVANIMNELYSALSAAERVFYLLEEPEEVADRKEAELLTEVNGDVELKQVSFGYEKGKTIIHNLDLKAEAGKLVAIVGPTGAGKTTMVKLLMRFYDVNKGAILIDDINIKDFKREDLRKLFGMVLQGTWLFGGTIKDNIRYSKPEADDSEVIEAAKAAHVHHFIKTLPKGYNSVLNEESSNVSAGQKQLLTIARVILADPKILILDEATSSIDTRTELQIQSAMDNLMKGRTSFIIAHRLSTIKNADLILVMNHGDIVEQGTHEELLAKNGFYADLYNSQFDEEEAV